MPGNRKYSDTDIGASKRSMLRGKERDSEKIRHELEFTCSVFFPASSENGLRQVCIKLESVKLFTLMNYELTVEIEKRQNEIDVNILGIKTKHSYHTEIEPAVAKIFCDELSGKFRLNIIKQDGCTNSAVLRFNPSKREVKILEENLLPGQGSYEFCSFNVTAE